MNDSRSRGHARLCALLSCCGVGAFVVICGAVQFLRGDLDWVAAPLSYYLLGPFGAEAIAAYLALSAGLIALGIGFRSALIASARSGALVLLFAVAGVALAVTALSEPAKAHGNVLEWEAVHRFAAMTTFLCVTVAMLLQSFWLRFDPRWRGRFPFAFALAALAFIALWIYALMHLFPSGISQKTVIALILAWLGWASLALLRETWR
ncbi:DUF998 domain-containing protein [Rudaea sp.]|uniref:DUF998 domain-containing protein n=1 Tax=Rudaea sp. TaxID=2136325 RepID=UPI0039C9A02C